MEFGIPILVNKFIEPVALDDDKFDEIWEDITIHRDYTFQKMDVILKNPAPPNVGHMDVLKKMAALLSEFFSLKILTPQNTTNFTQLKVSGQATFKGENQTSFPGGPSDIVDQIVVPVLAQIEFFPQVDMKEFRFSIRSTDTIEIARAILSLFKFFVNPTN